MITTAAASEFQFSDEKDTERYTLTRDGVLVSVLDYRDDGRTVAMTRAFTIPTYRGHGYAAMIVEHAVAEVEARGDRQIDPVCWYVGDWFEAHPEKKHLLRSR